MGAAQLIVPSTDLLHDCVGESISWTTLGGLHTTNSTPDYGLSDDKYYPGLSVEEESIL